MEEPHQRVQSGKLRVVSRRSNSESNILLPREPNVEYTGIESTTKLEIKDYEDSIEHYRQTPSSLTSLHINLFKEIAKGYGIEDSNAVDPYWRRTWNIGTWCIGNDVSISINIMQPNISNIIAVVTCNHDERMDQIVQDFKDSNLAKSTAYHSRIGKGYQLMGRWALHIIQKFIDAGFIKPENVQLGGCNIGQSRLFCWLLVGESSEYLCTLTKESVEELMRYLPDWCHDIREPSSAADISLRIKNPITANDSTTLSISVQGWVRYNGALAHISKLPEALSISIRSMMKSKKVFTFLDSLEYSEVPSNF